MNMDNVKPKISEIWCYKDNKENHHYIILSIDNLDTTTYNLYCFEDEKHYDNYEWPNQGGVWEKL